MKTFVADTDLIAEWDWESNTAQGLDPHILSHGSTKRVGWICSKGHNYMARIDHRLWDPVVRTVQGKCRLLEKKI